MTNFDFLLNDNRFSSFSEIAVKSEYLLHIDTDACIIICRRTLELAVKWIYQVEELQTDEKQPTLNDFLKDQRLKDLVGDEMWKRMDYIRRAGNMAAHEIDGMSEEQAILCLENLYEFMDFLAYCYADSYEEKAFDRELLALTPEEALSFVTTKRRMVEDVEKLDQATRMMLVSRRFAHQITYSPRHIDLSDETLRSIYRKTMLTGVDDEDELWLSFLNNYDV